MGNFPPPIMIGVHLPEGNGDFMFAVSCTDSKLGFVISRLNEV